jgi:hypothetical protein
VVREGAGIDHPAQIFKIQAAHPIPLETVAKRHEIIQPKIEAGFCLMNALGHKPVDPGDGLSAAGEPLVQLRLGLRIGLQHPNRRRQVEPGCLRFALAGPAKARGILIGGPAGRIQPHAGLDQIDVIVGGHIAKKRQQVLPHIGVVGAQSALGDILMSRCVVRLS